MGPRHRSGGAGGPSYAPAQEYLVLRVSGRWQYEQDTVE